MSSIYTVLHEKLKIKFKKKIKEILNQCQLFCVVIIEMICCPLP